MTGLWCLIGFLSWNLLGCAVLAFIDMPSRADGAYLNWLKSCPIPGLAQFLFWAIWPYIAVRYAWESAHD